MAGKRKGVRMIREIQRLRAMGLGKRAVARTLQISRNTLRKYWDLEEKEDVAVSPPAYQAPWSEKVDWDSARKAAERGQALAHYWEEFQTQLMPEDPLVLVPYVSFWREYRRRNPEGELRFGQSFKPGSCCEIDYKGSRPGFGYTDPRTGGFKVCELFGAMLRYSRYLSVDVTLSQQKADFYGSIDKAYRDFGGVPTISVTDNLTPAVKRSSRKGDADLNPDYACFCEHYGTVAIPAGPGKPTHKDGIEKEFDLFWRWFGHSLAGKGFTSLGALRDFTLEACDRYNTRVQRRIGESRKQRLEAEREAMAPVPETPYEYCEWKKVRPHPDCHIQVRYNYYSVPHAFRGKTLDARITARHLEVLDGTQRVALHALLPNNVRGRYQSEVKHYPPAQIFLLETLPQKLRTTAAEVGPQTLSLVERLFELGNHPLRYLRRIQGILGLLKEATSQELEKAVQMARMLGEVLPRPSILLEIVRQSRSLPEEVKPVERKPNRYVRGNGKIVAGEPSERDIQEESDAG